MLKITSTTFRLHFFNSSRRGSRIRRAFNPGGSGNWILQRRLLPGTVPVFYTDPLSPFGTNQASSASSVWPVDDPNKPKSATGGNQGASGAGGTSSITNYIVYQIPYYEGGPSAYVTQTEGGIVTTTEALPISPSGASLRTVEFHSLHRNTDQIQTDANGPYDIHHDGNGETTSTSSSAPFVMNVKNTDGTPATGTITVTFDISVSADDASGDNGVARFHRDAQLDIDSTYVHIVVEPNRGNGVRVLVPGTLNTVLAEDPNFSSGAAMEGNPSATLSYHYTATFPAAASVSVNYSSSLGSYVEGTFGGSQQFPQSEQASKISDFSWDFTMTAN
jgi:hypothetical protein